MCFKWLHLAMNVGLNGFVVKQNDQNIARANSTVIGWQICKTAVRIGSIYVTRQWIFLLAVWMIVLLIWWTWLYIFASFSWDTLFQNYVIVHKVQCWTVGAISTFGRSRMFGPEKLRSLAVGRSRSRRLKIKENMS